MTNIGEKVLQIGDRVKCNDLMDLKQLSRDLDRAGYRFVVDRENFVIRITGKGADHVRPANY